MCSVVNCTAFIALFRCSEPVMRNELKFIVCETELFDLLRSCEYCVGVAEVHTKVQQGTYLQVQQVRN